MIISEIQGRGKMIFFLNTYPCTTEDLEAVDSLTAPTESTVISTNNQISNAKELDIETEEDANVSENNGDKIFEETDAGTDTAQGNEGNASSKEGGAQTAGDILLNAITKQGMLLILDGSLEMCAHV